MDVNVMCSPLGSIKAGILMQNYVKEPSLKMTVWISVLFVFVFLHTKIRFSYDIERSGEITLLNVWLA